MSVRPQPQVVAAASSVLVLLLVARLVPGADARWDDNVNLYTPLLATAVRLWREGSFAWNPYAHLGEPFVPQIGGGAFYPPGLALAALLPLEDVPQGWLLLHAAIAAAGAAFAARRLGAAPAGATLAGVVYALSGELLYLEKAWMVFAVGAAWLPWFVGLVAAPRPGGRDLALAALVLGLEVHAGGVEPAVYSGALGLLLALLRDGWRGRPVRVAVLALALGGLLAAPLVLETLAAIPGSNRSRPIGPGHELAPEAILGAILPALPWRPGLAWSRIACATPVYQGFVPLLLLVAVPWRVRSRVERALVLTGAVALFFALGSHIGADEVWRRLPLVGYVRHAVGRLQLVALAFALVAAHDVGRLAGLSRRRLAVAALSLAAVGLVATVTAAALAREFVAAHAGALAAELVATVVATAALLACGPAQRPLAAVLAASALLAVQLVAGWPSTSTSRPFLGGEVGWVASSHHLGASQGRVATVFSPHELAALPLRQTIGRGYGGALGVPSISGYSMVYGARTRELWGLDHTGEIDEARWRTLLSGAALEAAGVRWVHGATTLRDLLARSPKRFLLRARTPLTMTLENPSYRGRAYRVARAEPAAPGADSLARADLLDVALLDPGSRAASFVRGEVLSFSERPGTIEVQLAPVAGESFLVVTSAFAKGWRAEVDGEPVAVERVLEHLMGVAVPAGGARVVLRYESAPLRLGLALAAAGLVLVAVVGLRRGA